jgi:hypothetical protein
MSASFSTGLQQSEKLCNRIYTTELLILKDVLFMPNRFANQKRFVCAPAECLQNNGGALGR